MQILEWGSNSTIFYLTFDTHDSPEAVFIWKWEIYRLHLLLCIPYASANKESDRSFCYMLSMQFVTKGTEFSMYIIHISTKKDIERCKNIVYRTNTPLLTPFLKNVVVSAKLYIPSTLNIDLILWHTQLIVCAVKC